MKTLIAGLLAGLTFTSVGLFMSYPETATDADALLYWVSDPNPLRTQQIEGFHEWLERQPGAPEIELRLDSSSAGPQKIIIQGVSGTLGDVFDTYSDWFTYHYSLGITADVTEPALEMGFSPDKTYEHIRPDITVDGRQFCYPLNALCKMLWVNKATFERFGQPLPPMEWDMETFERMGKAFVEAANPPGEPPRYFYCASVDPIVMRRSLGLSDYNETLTQSRLNDERYIYVLEKLYQWTYEDRILPTLADQASFSTQAGWGGAELQLFVEGNYAMFHMGRYALIQLREYDGLDLDVVYHPGGEFTNVRSYGRLGAVYRGSENEEYTKYFLAYLASEDYNMKVIRAADAMPPNPAFLESEEYLRPPEHPEEWGLHEKFAEAMLTRAVSYSLSPFVVPMDARQVTKRSLDDVLANRLSPELAAANAETSINTAIEEYLEQRPELRQEYERRLEIQAKIDDLRAKNEPVPLNWIYNPFYRKYYQEMGWAEETR